MNRNQEEKNGWEQIDIGDAAKGENISTGHGGLDLKLAKSFVETVLQNNVSPIDVYRCIEYALPGIIANKSAQLGGVPLEIPDFRHKPFSGTAFWDTIGLPDTEPLGKPYKKEPL